jgi:hypothetical protein
MNMPLADITDSHGTSLELVFVGRGTSSNGFRKNYI